MRRRLHYLALCCMLGEAAIKLYCLANLSIMDSTLYCENENEDIKHENTENPNLSALRQNIIKLYPIETSEFARSTNQIKLLQKQNVTMATCHVIIDDSGSGSGCGHKKPHPTRDLPVEPITIVIPLSKSLVGEFRYPLIKYMIGNTLK